MARLVLGCNKSSSVLVFRCSTLELQLLFGIVFGGNGAGLFLRNIFFVKKTEKIVKMDQTDSDAQCQDVRNNVSLHS